MQKMKVLFIKVKTRNEKKMFFKNKESTLENRNNRICSDTFFQTMLDHNASSSAVWPFIRKLIYYNNYVIGRVRCVLVKRWCSSNRLNVLLLYLSSLFLLIPLNLKSITVSLFKYFVLITILLLFFFNNLFQCLLLRKGQQNNF